MLRSDFANRIWPLVILIAGLLRACDGQTTYCSGTQYLSVNGSGEIASHSGAGLTYYRNNMLCQWQLTAPTGSIITAMITYADFETCCDFVTLYDGAIGSTSVISKVSVTASSGYVSPTFITSSNIMSVYFYTDGSALALGFKLVVSSLTSSSSCGAISYTNSSNMSGVVTSHVGYNGILPYSPNMTCVRTLPKRSGYTIAMSVTALSLASGDCLRLPVSALTISSGATSTSTMYCGVYSISSTMLVDSDEDAHIIFSSNGQSQSTGYSISFDYAQLIMGSFSSVISNTEEIISHSGVGSTPYSNNVRYYWQITGPTGTYLTARFTYLNLDSASDVIAVYSVYNSFSNLLANLTGSTSSRVYSTSSNVLSMRFLTGSTNTALGFRVQVSAVTTDSSTVATTATESSLLGGIISGVIIAAIIVIVIIVLCICCKSSGGSRAVQVQPVMQAPAAAVSVSVNVNVG